MTRIRVELTVEVDPEEWELVYGVPPAELRADVRAYIGQAVDELAGGIVRVVKWQA